MKVSEIIGKVEYVKEGESLSKTIPEYKAIYARRRAEHVELDKSPNRQALGRLQDRGLGQKQADLPEIKIVGK